MLTPEQLFPEIDVIVRDNRKLSFKTFADLSQFWKVERKHFSGILENSHAARNNPSAQFLSQVRERRNAMDAQINEARQFLLQNHTQSSESELRLGTKRSADNLISVIQRVYRNDTHGLWLSDEPVARFVLEMEKDDLDAAAYAFLYLRRADFLDDNYAAKSGAFRAQLYQANVTDLRGDAEAAAFRLSTAKWQAEMDRMREEMQVDKDAAHALNEEYSAELSKQREAASGRAEEFEKFLAARQEEQTVQLTAAHRELGKLVAVYDQHMKLKAPVEYWRLKKDRHLDERQTLKCWTIAIGILSFLLMAAYLIFVFPEDKPGVIPYHEIIGFFILSSLAFWTVKILVRLLLSSIHLAEDAAEREVMAMTYMALVRGDEGSSNYLDEKDRALVLGPLFRPSSTGVIDDGAPPHASEVFAKIRG